jgi:hypothetical protein
VVRGRRWHEVGFAAAFVQMLGASLFQVSVVAGVPHLIPAASWQLADALIWTPQVRPRACGMQPVTWCGHF